MLFIQEVFSLYIGFYHARSKSKEWSIEVPGMLHIRQHDRQRSTILPGIYQQLEAPQQNLCGKRIAVTATATAASPRYSIEVGGVRILNARLEAVLGHGGKNGGGQADILAAYGLTEASVRRIRSCMDVVE